MTKQRLLIFAAGIMGAGFLLGLWFGQDSNTPPPDRTTYIAASPEELGPRQLRLSPTAMKLAEIQTTAVEKRFVANEIRMVGKVDYDETRVATISAWIPGRLERLYVDYTGVSVQPGDHLVSIYSPDLYIAQQELMQAAQAVAAEISGNQRIQERNAATLQATREKLRLWGLTPEQIGRIEQSRELSDLLTIYSPISGIIIHKQALEGMYVKTGDHIYTIADLSQLWVRLDAYESDLSWLHYGQEVEFVTEAYPGKPFRGRIAFIDPVLNPDTRTVKVRVNVPNPEGQLKPGMFVRAIVHASVNTEGKIDDPALAGKWISPMHPEIIRDQPGACDVCGLPLVSTESLGYATADMAQSSAPLIIPASAPLITGKRAVVYVADANDPGIFEGREIVLGPRAGNFYHVLSGLQEGEQVVVHGAFKIDSEIQIQAGPSMMSPEGGGPVPGHDHGATPTPAPRSSPVSVEVHTDHGN
ncbi:MAG: efflux RND transporter periplasmic adaptor subunit [Pseudomonadales bacterium]|nr:efflux RND transporter periplasmic adaptor subunit [Pseudomonadales bacterium]